MLSGFASSSLLTVVIAVVATLLALAILVQVLQEMWKYLNSTRARVYTRVLIDFAGPSARRMTEQNVLPDLVARGPFQLRRLSPKGRLLPLAKDDLVEGLERTAAPWHRRALRVLRTEVEIQNGQTAPPSSEYLRFMTELAATDPGGPGNLDRTDLIRFFEDTSGGAGGVPQGMLDAQMTLRVFRERFLSHVLDVERHFQRLQELFDYQYKRRNLVLTFVFGVVVAFLLGFPVQAILRRAAAMSADQVTTLAANVRAIYQQLPPPRPDTTTAGRSGALPSVSSARDTGASDQAVRPSLDTLLVYQSRAALESLLAVLKHTTTPAQDSTWRTLLVGLNEFLAEPGTAHKWTARLWYFWGCVLTGVLVSFGAPFWNDLLGALSLKNRPPPKDSAPAGDESVG